MKLAVLGLLPEPIPASRAPSGWVVLGGGGLLPLGQVPVAAAESIQEGPWPVLTAADGLGLSSVWNRDGPDRVLCYPSVGELKNCKLGRPDPKVMLLIPKSCSRPAVNGGRSCGVGAG